MTKKGLLICPILAVLMISAIFLGSKSINRIIVKNNEHKMAQSIDKLPTALTLRQKSDIDEENIDIEEVYKSADVVFVGKYIGDNRVFSIGDHINTEASFQVTKVLKGNIPSDRMENNIVKVQYYSGEVTLDEFYNNMQGIIRTTLFSFIST